MKYGNRQFKIWSNKQDRYTYCDKIYADEMTADPKNLINKTDETYFLKLDRYITM